MLRRPGADLGVVVIPDDDPKTGRAEELLVREHQPDGRSAIVHYPADDGSDLANGAQALAAAAWPLLAMPEEASSLSFETGKKRYAYYCGCTAKAWGLPFEVVLALGPNPAAAAIWRRMADPASLRRVSLSQAYDLRAGIDRRRMGLRAAFDAANLFYGEGRITWEEFNEFLPRPIAEMGQHNTAVLALALFESIRKDAARHGLKK
jgi:hypothetical protein